MKVTWELDTAIPGDLRVIGAMNNLIRVTTAPSPGEKQGEEPAPAKTEERHTTTLIKPMPDPEPEKEIDPKPEPEKTEPKKRQPKIKDSKQLDKLSLEEMIAYLKARKDHSMLDARFLAKHYQGKFGEHESLLTVLHDLGANNFEDLKEPGHFIKNAIPMIEEKLAGSPDATGDIFGV